MTIVVEPASIPTPEIRLPKADKCVLVIFGATGDLTRRKLMPALYHLACLDCTTDEFHIVGVGRAPMGDEQFRDRMHEALRSAGAGALNEREWRAFASRLHYLVGNLADSATYRRIAARLEELHTRVGASTNRMFYLAIPPSLVSPIVDGLAAAELQRETDGWSRVIVEKPFGRDLASARALNTHLARTFREDQIFRIDHYLGKDTVRNILVFRLGNSLFEPVWNRHHIDYVEITAAETVGVGSRGGYYEEAGALRDMVANHLLQLLALTAMEPPVAFEADAVRDQKIQVWRSISPMTPEEIAERTLRGQYGPGEIDGEPVPGYRLEPGIAPGSVTETYAALELRIENWRWAGVPFYLRTGKRLSRRVTEIAIHFKRPPLALFPRTTSCEPNVIELRIQPSEGISIVFGAKVPGAEMITTPVHTNFCYQRAFAGRLPDAYETLLLDAMRGDATLFIRRDGVETQWRLITPIAQAWARQSANEFPNYAAGTNGPAAADRLLARNGHRWRRLGDIVDACVD